MNGVYELEPVLLGWGLLDRNHTLENSMNISKINAYSKASRMPGLCRHTCWLSAYNYLFRIDRCT